MAARDVVEQLQRRPGAFLWAFVRRVVDLMVERFARNNILTYASAMSAQLLTAAVPLALLALLLLGAFGEQSVWRHQIAPSVSDTVSKPAYKAVDSIVEALIAKPHTHWLVLAAAIVLWEISGVVRAVMGALNAIFGYEEARSFLRRFGTSFALAPAVALCCLGALLVASRGGGWLSLGPLQPLWTIVRWLVVLALLWAVVALLLRFAPARAQSFGWVTFGGVFVIAAWVGATLVFGWWVTSVANYRTPFGTAVALLTFAGYLYTSSIVFLVGAQVDQLLREQAEPGRGPLDGLA